MPNYYLMSVKSTTKAPTTETPSNDDSDYIYFILNSYDDEPTLVTPNDICTDLDSNGYADVIINVPIGEFDSYFHYSRSRSYDQKGILVRNYVYKVPKTTFTTIDDIDYESPNTAEDKDESRTIYILVETWLCGQDIDCTINIKARKSEVISYMRTLFDQYPLQMLDEITPIDNAAKYTTDQGETEGINRLFTDGQLGIGAIDTAGSDGSNDVDIEYDSQIIFLNKLEF